jgi:hypothetical protein
MTVPAPDTVAVEIVVPPPPAEPPELPVLPVLPLPPLPLVVESFPQAARSSTAAANIGPIHRATRLFFIVPPEMIGVPKGIRPAGPGGLAKDAGRRCVPVSGGVQGHHYAGGFFPGN